MLLEDARKGTRRAIMLSLSASAKSRLLLLVAFRWSPRTLLQYSRPSAAPGKGGSCKGGSCIRWNFMAALHVPGQASSVKSCGAMRRREQTQKR